jgi:hypothetical protein
MIPWLDAVREAYQKGLKSGRQAKVYDDNSRHKALLRFKAKYVDDWGIIGGHLIANWGEGWIDAEKRREE